MQADNEDALWGEAGDEETATEEGSEKKANKEEGSEKTEQKTQRGSVLACDFYNSGALMVSALVKFCLLPCVCGEWRRLWSQHGGG